MPNPKKTKITSRPLAHTWVHPADGDNYPDELTMTIEESGSFGVRCWTTRTDYGPGWDRISEWQYIHPEGASYIMYVVRCDDGRWSFANTMATERWYVRDGSHNAARELMREYFTAGGYEERS